MGVSPSPRRYWRRGSGRRSQQQTCAAVVLPMACNILTSMPPEEPRLQHGYGKIGKTYQSNWIISTGRGENKNCLKPPPRIHDRNTPIKWNNPFHQPGFCFCVKVSRPGNIIRQCLALPPCWDPFFWRGHETHSTMLAAGCIYLYLCIYASFEDE